MYSRTPNSFRTASPVGRREPSYRRMGGLPPNYGGIAFGEEGSWPRQDDAPPVEEKADRAVEEVAIQESTPPLPVEGKPSDVSMPSGLGYEDLLLLGLIFFLRKEGDGEGDLRETLLLLGLLLLMG